MFCLVGYVKSGAEIMACLKSILDNPSPQVEHPIAVLTSQDRDTWSTVREKLVKSGTCSHISLSC